MTQYLASLWMLFGGLWIYLFIAFTAAAVVEEFVSTKRLLRYFGKNDVPSLLRATFAGAMASTCSCGALIMAASFKKRGASTATMLTFILAAPFLGLPMLFVFFSFLGVPNTLLLMATGLIVAFCSGLTLARLENKGIIEQGTLKQARGAAHEHRARGGKNSAEEGYRSSEQHCAKCKADAQAILRRRLFYNVPAHFWHSVFDIGKWIILGLFVAAFIATSIPEDTITRYLGKESGISSIFIALPFAAVIETCSEGFAIVGGQLYSMGAGLAAVFVLLMVGVATDLTELLVVWRKFGRRAALAYLGVGTALTLVAAMVLLLQP